MFCKTVWNGLHILPDGYIRLCSIGANSDPMLDMQRARDKDGNVMHILTHDIKDIMNSDKHREVRRLNVEDPNAWSDHCSCCKDREVITNFNRLHKNRSRRVYLMDIEDNDVVSESTCRDNKIDADGNVNWYPSSLDIRFGNLCNQKCVMCSPDFSNLWYDEHFDFFKTTFFGQGSKLHVIKDVKTGKWKEPEELKWFEDPRWWDKFEEMAPHLRHIYITGGEPMVTPAHDEMLDRLIASGHAEHIWLEYDTNASAINDKIAQRWFHFKKVDIRASMDAINEQYELIRFGGKWKKFVKNIKKLHEYQIQSNEKIKLLCVSTCFQMTTIYSIIESEQWAKSVGIDFHMRFLEGPSHHRVASLSKNAKLKLIEYFSQYIGKSEKAPLIVKYLSHYLDSKVENPFAVQKFVKFMDYLDTTRGTDWKNIIPDVHKLVEYSLTGQE